MPPSLYPLNAFASWLMASRKFSDNTIRMYVYAVRKLLTLACGIPETSDELFNHAARLNFGYRAHLRGGWPQFVLYAATQGEAVPPFPDERLSVQNTLVPDEIAVGFALLRVLVGSGPSGLNRYAILGGTWADVDVGPGMALFHLHGRGGKPYDMTVSHPHVDRLVYKMRDILTNGYADDPAETPLFPADLHRSKPLPAKLADARIDAAKQDLADYMRRWENPRKPEDAEKVLRSVGLWDDLDDVNEGSYDADLAARTADGKPLVIPEYPPLPPTVVSYTHIIEEGGMAFTKCIYKDGKVTILPGKRYKLGEEP